MAWQIEIDEAAKKELGKLDPQVARRVIQFLRTRLKTVSKCISKLLRSKTTDPFSSGDLGKDSFLESQPSPNLFIKHSLNRNILIYRYFGRKF